MKIKKLGALLVSAALCAGMAAPAFAFEGEAAPVEQPVLPEVVEKDVVTVTDETSGALTPEGNLTLVDDYYTNYSDGSGQQFITLGLVALALCPLVQYGSQLIVEAEYRNPNYDFSTLFENVVWGNTQMFFPISLVMIGSWLIDRESTHDTLKNIMTIPVSMPKMLGAKLFSVLSGCTKDEVLDQYNNIVQSAGSIALTGNSSLQGTKEKGIDDYTGSYTANYEDFSDTEYLFGGTSIKREAGKDLSIDCALEVTDGTAKVFWISGADEEVTLLETTGTYSDTITLPEGGNYIGIECENFTGSIELNME